LLSPGARVSLGGLRPLASPVATLALLVSFAGSAHAEPAAAAAAARAAAERDRIARRWAPTLYQETRSEADYITSFDFDGDWDGSNNAAHLKTTPEPAVVYFTVAETKTHWFVTYVLYHPIDGKVPSGHDHDTEHVTLVVRKDDSPGGRRDGGGDGRLEAMESRFHNVLYQYAVAGAGVQNGADDVDGPIHFDADGRPAVYIQRTGHGICGGFSPPVAFLDALSLSCHHKEAPHIARRGVIYRYRGVAQLPRGLDDRDVGYALVEVGDTLWVHARSAGPHATFASLIDFRGERCREFECPRGIGGVLAAARGHGSTGMPWEEGGGRGVHARGSAFFDPAFTLARRLRFAAPFSTEYLFNPYLGVGRFASQAGSDVASASTAHK
jgi:hypothetical protein